MNTDVYEKLRKFFDQFPVGFPKTDEGIEIEILKRFFSVEEAEFAIQLPFMGADPPKNIQMIANQMGRDVKEAEGILDSMVEKALVYRIIDEEGSKAFALLPFVPSIIEFSAKKLDPEVAHLLERYLYGAFAQEMIKPKTPLVKVIPVNQSISPQIIIQPYENVVKAIEDSRSLCVMEWVMFSVFSRESLFCEGCSP